MDKDSKTADTPKEQEWECHIDDLNPYDKKLIKGLMRGFARIMILWLISKKKQHGYEIMTQIHASSPLDKKMPSASMIYPVLHKLEKEGLISGTWDQQGKRKVKFYEITDEGENSLNRIRQIAAHGRKMGTTDLWKEFMMDMFFLNGEIGD
ncbi:MAG: PadR family transcriptional regulator [Euryarchaeota archaeon]|jgi:DNA-binding PadR family transcriptional regulator|uniref:PadR family transcriptional regulator n=1 Tax=Methanobacterium sp. MZD130B TaxID=3394378 RepID=UPI001770C2B4|nr:PadR family transcriptional regulator [Euryarchaeota archaeon]HHT19736.1 PadR family transcriptional regulator [Methanobacterium sp.]